MANVFFFEVQLVGEPDEDVLRDLLNRHRSVYGPQLSLFDGRPYTYVEIDAWLADSQQTALHLIGLGAMLGMWEIITPHDVPNLTPGGKALLGKIGFVALQAPTTVVAE